MIPNKRSFSQDFIDYFNAYLRRDSCKYFLLHCIIRYNRIERY